MGEPRLLTEREHFHWWEAYNPLGKGFKEFLEYIIAIILVFAFNGIVAAEIYATGHSQSGPKLMIFFFVSCIIGVIAYLLFRRYERKQFKLWTQRFPYNPEREYTDRDFEKEA